jgi:hypothetical protein
LAKTKSLASTPNTDTSLVHDHSSTYGILVCLVLNNLTLVYCEQCLYAESELCRIAVQRLLQPRYPNDVMSVVLYNDLFYDNPSMWCSMSFPTPYPDDVWGMLWNCFVGRSPVTGAAA